MIGAGLPVGRATRRSRAVQTARSALASGRLRPRGLDGENRRVDWADSKPARRYRALARERKMARAPRRDRAESPRVSQFVAQMIAEASAC